ncbi:hypothetical protein BX661DRAFT_207732 [Kickxella alabastrina]|uniref:uncharacterized protein n=1 Tax=Kickxella alabastrina TaxID=61397 RepID=UPI0022206E57|nr:uncharacterized protein BX661DRAFT_207732 [Kickxella alabastrina]KAI7820910.1 hypothetical protein BX661DRAFT_207732 [Kickxella alabastrina]
MSLDSAGLAEREARRKARYRGNPERARFRREERFNLNITERHHFASAQPAPSSLEHGIHSMDIVQSPLEGTGSELNSFSALTDTPESLHEPETLSDLESEPVSDIFDRQKPTEHALGSSKKPPGAKTRRQSRENIDISSIDHVLQGLSKRMTRSMAREVGGVQPPRRYFGEGVSTSQILRPYQAP